jgi:hypothetical protein
MSDYMKLRCAEGNYYVKVNEETHLVANVSSSDGSKFKIVAEKGYEYLLCIDNNKIVQQSQSSDADIEASATTVNEYATFRTKAIPHQPAYHGIVSDNNMLWQADASDQHVRADGDPTTLATNQRCWFARVVTQ